MTLSDLEKLRIGCERGNLDGVSATEFLFAMAQLAAATARAEKAEARFGFIKRNCQVRWRVNDEGICLGRWTGQYEPRFEPYRGIPTVNTFEECLDNALKAEKEGGE